MSSDLSNTLRGIWQAGRPNTGLYAFLVSYYSFWFYDQTDSVAVVTSITFALITMSIMRYNDLIDGPNDQRKGKCFATKHKQPLQIAILCESLAVIAGLFLLSAQSTESASLALFCGVVWILGLAYSHIPHWYITQNVVVAVCSGSPALCAAVYHGAIGKNDFHTFLMFSSLIWLSEVHKDIEDVHTDGGYKDTLAIRKGAIGAMLILVPSLQILSATFFWHPNALLQLVALTLIPLMTYQQGLHLLGRISVEKPMQTMNHVIMACGAALFAPLIWSNL